MLILVPFAAIPLLFVQVLLVAAVGPLSWQLVLVMGCMLAAVLWLASRQAVVVAPFAVAAEESEDVSQKELCKLFDTKENMITSDSGSRYLLLPLQY